MAGCHYKVKTFMLTSEQAPTGDSPPMAMEDRIGAIFGDAPPQPVRKAPPPIQQPEQAAEESEAASEVEAEAPAETAPTSVEVEFNGKTYEVPPELKEAFIRESDYTRKTQKVAETQRTLEHRAKAIETAEMQYQFQQSIAKEIAEVQAIDHQLSQYDGVNWREIPAEDRTLHMLEMQRLEKLKTAKVTELGQKYQEHEAKIKDRVSALKKESRELLAKELQWSDATEKEVRDWAVSNGITEAEIDSVHDPRHLKILWKASQYDKARKSAQPAIAQAKTAKVSSSNPMPPQVKEKLAFHRALKSTESNPQQRKSVIENRVMDIFQKR